MKKKNDLWELRPKSKAIHGARMVTDKNVRPRLAREVASGLGSDDRAGRLFAGEEDGFIYFRMNNETVDRFERCVSNLEGAQAAVATASGMAAIDLLYRFITSYGDHIISSPKVYGGVRDLFGNILTSDGREVSFVSNPHDVREWERLIRPNTKAFHIENPSNPLIDVFDIRPLVKLAHENRRNIQVVADHTLATHVLYKPLQLGVDWIADSKTKYIGDGEVGAGSICGMDTEAMKKLRKTRFWNTGACLSPDNAQILIYHLESINTRMMEHCENAEKMAEFLSKHEYVERVHYPTIGSRAEFNRSIMPRGFGGLLSFDLKGDEDDAKRFLEGLKLFWHAANIGEAGSLVIRPWNTTHRGMDPKDRLAVGITPSTIRLSMGREDFLDQKEDLVRNGFSKIKFKKSQRP